MAGKTRSEALQHFLTLAVAGRLRGAKIPENAAYALARMCVNRVPSIDVQAVQGLAEFALMCAEDNVLAGGIVEGTVRL